MLQRLYERLKPKPKPSDAPAPFRLVPGQSIGTIKYNHFGFGTLSPTSARASHYFRLRPFLGRGDPVLVSGGLQQRKMLVERILAEERREISRELWTQFFRLPPSHVVHFGWKSFVTGHCHPVLYLPVNFRLAQYTTSRAAQQLADRWGEWFLRTIERQSDTLLLCPPTHDQVKAQLTWLGVSFCYLEWYLLENRDDFW